MKLLFQFLTLALLPTLNVAAQTKTLSRLIALSRYNHNGTEYKLSDTESFVYSGGRGGDNYYNLPCDIGLAMRNDTSTGIIDSNNKTIKTFNGANKTTSIVNLAWDYARKSWQNRSRTQYTYDANNNETEQETENWVYSLSVWEKYELKKCTYDLFNNKTTETKLNWNKSKSSWVNSNLTLRDYDLKNNVIKYEYLTWDEPTSNWVKSNKTEYIFDINNNNTLVQNFRWDNTIGNYVNSSKTEFTFSSTNKLLSEKNFDSPLGSWIPNREAYHVYDLADNPILFWYKDWNTLKSAWINQSRINYTFDASGNLALGISERGFNDTGWVTWFKHEYDYDASKNKTSEIYSVWNNTSSNFDTVNHIGFTYNIFNQRTRYTWDFWDNLAKKFTPFKQSNYYYEDYTASINNSNKEAGQLSLFPIPSSTELNINLTWEIAQPFKIKITDISGNLIKAQQHPIIKHYSGTIPVQELSDGIYFITFEGKNESRITRPFVIAK